MGGPLELGKPVAEVLVEGELSPFEHEALFQILRKRFILEQPSYVELPDENLVTRVNITFHHAYDLSFFTQVFQENWRDLKDLLEEVRHRRGKAGAAFNLTFIDKESRLVFRSGLLNSEELCPTRSEFTLSTIIPSNGPGLNLGQHSPVLQTGPRQH